MNRFIGILGIFVILGISYLLSNNKKNIDFRLIIWGLGLSALFRKVCKGRDCIVIQAPNTKEIEKNIYGFEGNCYTFKSQVTSWSSKVIKTSPLNLVS